MTRTQTAYILAIDTILAELWNESSKTKDKNYLDEARSLLIKLTKTLVKA